MGVLEHRNGHPVVAVAEITRNAKTLLLPGLDPSGPPKIAYGTPAERGHRVFDICQLRPINFPAFTFPTPDAHLEIAAAMWPPTAADTRGEAPPGGVTNEGKKKKRKKKKKRPTNDPSSSGEHDSGIDAGLSPPAKQEQPTESGGPAPASRDVPGPAAVAAARPRRNSEDASGSAAEAASVNDSSSGTGMLAPEDAMAGIAEDGGDDDDDVGVVIQRERLPTPTGASGTPKKKKTKKAKKAADGTSPPPAEAAVANGNEGYGAAAAAAAAAGDKAAPKTESSPQKKKRKKKRRKSSQDAGDGDPHEEPSSGIPYALAPQGSVRTPGVCTYSLVLLHSVQQ